MKTVCVYLGAQFGNDNKYSDEAILLGKKIAAVISSLKIDPR
ncbi:hypothetical protein SAMN02746093_00006 [Legionella quinlivanii DSM 21216]|nr:hypothetical protein [Legionella quinlivanii]SEF39171.1 hypothetical protein SAMN02746093_00006 [Legionella quinlivanii DSM 21216]STY12092.1 Uncharacterised protein [Legionella quinlivanii]